MPRQFLVRRISKAALVVVAVACLVHDARGANRGCKGRVVNYLFGGYGVGPFGYGYFPYAGHATHGAGCGKYGFSYSAAGVVGSHNEHVANCTPAHPCPYHECPTYVEFADGQSVPAGLANAEPSESDLIDSHTDVAYPASAKPANNTKPAVRPVAFDVNAVDAKAIDARPIQR